MDDLLRIANHGHASLPLDVLAALTLLSLAPFVLVLSTSFVRIVVVLSLVRSAIGAAEFVRLQPGDVVKLGTKVGAPASLNLGGRRLATGVPGVVASRTAFLVHDVAMGAHSR